MIADSAKTKIQSFIQKKNQHPNPNTELSWFTILVNYDNSLTQEDTSKNILSEESARLWDFFATFICHQVPFFLKSSLKFINF